ncbi:MAG TPA: DUF3857 domain-containing protein [Puia sp.]
MKLLHPCLVLLIFSIRYSCAGQSGEHQDTVNLHFGAVSAIDFKVMPPVTDSTADAVILADIGRTELEGYERGFRIVFKRWRRIRILNRRGIDIATVRLDFSADDNGDKRLKDLKAYAYNLENGKITRTEVEKKDFFVDKESGDDIEERFTFPNVKVGSVIEYSYTIKSSDYFRLRPWHFQGEYPTLFSMYTVVIPDIFNFVFLFNGQHPEEVESIRSDEGTTVAGNAWFRTHTLTTSWVLKNVPAMKEEPYTFSLDNYISQVRFQLSMRPLYPGRSEILLSDWQFVCNRLLYDDRFGVPLSGKNNWLNGDMEKIIEGSSDAMSRANKIFAYVRDNFRAEGRGVMLSTNAGLQDVFRKKIGSVADVNLLLIAMLRHEHIEADPVILSTRDNGETSEHYPILDHFNYLVCKAVIDGRSYYLDASVPRIGFGKLPVYCYNGHARVMAKESYPVYFRPDSLTETNMTTVFVYNGENNHMDITYSENAGYFRSLDVREELAKTPVKEYIDKLAKDLPSEVAVDTGGGINNLQAYESPGTIHCNMRFNFSVSDPVYFPPMLNAGLKRNPFVSANRSYPVELPYKMDDTYVLNMEMPKGYKVDELPKSVKVSLNESDGFFEYTVSADAEHILLKSRLVLKKTVFSPEDYPTLRDFFGFVVKKENELIVFKKL